MVQLTGFISTSLKRDAAEAFVWANQDSGHEATLFEIMFKRDSVYYVMDMSAFPEEREVLLYDGCKFEVMSIDQTKDKHGNLLNIVVL